MDDINTAQTGASFAARMGLMAVLLMPCSCFCASDADFDVLTSPSSATNSVAIVGNKSDAVVVVDTNDYPVVQLAARFFADDVQRVSGRRPVVANVPVVNSQLIIAGTLGDSPLVDALAAHGKLKDVEKIRGHWESTLFQIIENPFPGVERSLVILGSDRRGTAYGLMQLSEKIGVSPWYWWADVPVQRHDTLAVKFSSPLVSAPGVKYRGIFINDEDWGLNPWASKTFDPQFGNIGPGTYEKVFELMLRLRLNYIWPAMHKCSTEFGSVPENVALAGQYGIVAGSSHCEPMLYNNVHWNEKIEGRWNYRLNRDAIYSIWEQTAKARGNDEAVWTLGIRGIHDAPMETPPTAMPDKIKLVARVISDQRNLLNQYATTNWGPIAQCFVPYKEVLPIYDAGLPVPDDVTLVWVDDNFGYIRRLSTPLERRRSGGAGVYWHLSYYGAPHSYTWIDTTAPALMWEELYKAWENDARNLWVINVGDIKPAEIGIDYFSRLAWNPDGFNLGAQRQFLHEFSAKAFGETVAAPVTDLLMDFYRLGTIRKPELMDRDWALSLTPERAAQLEQDYKILLQREQSVFKNISAGSRDAFTELIAYPARVVGDTGLIFMADRKIQEGESSAAITNETRQLRDDLEAQVKNYNTKIAGGKWNRVMPGLVTGKTLMAWSSEVRWPWGEKSSPNLVSLGNRSPAEGNWRDAATADRQVSDGAAHWSRVEGLGASGEAMLLQSAGLNSAPPALEFDFRSRGGDAGAFVDFLPAFRLYPGMKLRVAVRVDNQPAALVEVPGSGGAENENGAIRSDGVQNNYVRAQIPLPNLAPGKHTLTIRAVDPGAVIDRVWLP